MGELAPVKLAYDAAADAAYLLLVDEILPGEAPRLLICDLEIKDGAVILLLNENDRLLGLEILGASRLLLAEVLESAPATSKRD